MYAVAYDADSNSYQIIHNVEETYETIEEAENGLQIIVAEAALNVFWQEVEKSLPGHDASLLPEYNTLRTAAYAAVVARERN